jgi:hypothetical protein
MSRFDQLLAQLERAVGNRDALIVAGLLGAVLLGVWIAVLVRFAAGADWPSWDGS